MVRSPMIGAWYRFRQLYRPERVVSAVLGIKADGTVVERIGNEGGSISAGLRQPSLRGSLPGIVVADGAGGIEAAASEVYPWAKFQRCC
ncbi:MAG: hypothetical protein ACUVWX_08670 [Kiritimatiellia bacterium]